MQCVSHVVHQLTTYNNKPMITTQELNFGYNRNSSVLSHLTLTLPSGHVYGLFGKNGVGKSTLLKLLCGALHGKGLCQIDGIDSASRSIELLKQLCFVPETLDIRAITIEELAKVTKPFYPTFSDELLNYCIAELEVPTGIRLTKMSLGQQKKAIIAVAVACNTPYLLLDEPTNGMDIPSKAALRRIIASIASPEKLIIISTHQVDDLENLIDAAIIMDNNGILLSETLETIGQKLSFGPFDGASEIIYSEETLRGTWCVTRNESGIEAPVDMKLLFSAVVKHPGEFKQIFKQH